MKRPKQPIDHLRGVPIFEACSRKDLEAVGRAMDTLAVETGEDVVSEGEAGSEFFVVLSGTAAVIRGGTQVAELGAGDFFGELGLLIPARRNATIRAQSPMKVGVLGFREFQALLQTVRPLRIALLASIARRIRATEGPDAVLGGEGSPNGNAAVHGKATTAELLRRVSLFVACSPKELERIVRSASEHSVAAGTKVVNEGDTGDAFYVVAEGLASAWVSGKKVGSIAAGSFFGELALLDPGPRVATVTTELPTRLLTIPASGFRALLDEYPAVAGKVAKTLATRLAALDVDPLTAIDE